MFVSSILRRLPGMGCAWSIVLGLVCAEVRGGEPAEARGKMLGGDYAAALAAADLALKESPDEDWYLVRIESLLATGKYEEALAAAEAALKHDERSLRLKWLARETYLANGRTKEAAAVPEEIERLMSTWTYRDTESIVIFGKALLLRGTDPKLILDKVFAAAQKRDPQSRAPFLARGTLALEKNDGALAAKAFQEGLKLFPGDPDFLCGMAEAHASSDREEMESSLEAALTANPRHVRSLLLKAGQRIDAENYAEAAVLLDRVIEVNPWQPDAWAYRAVLAHLRYDAAGEKEARSSALKFWKSNPRVDHLIGQKLSRKYRFAEGASHQRQALVFDASYLPAKSQLASDLLRLGDEDEGWKLAGKVHELDAYDVAAFNLMTLHDTMKAKFTMVKNDDFTVRMASNEAPVYGARVLDLLGRARRTLGAKYGVDVARPTIVEIFPEQNDFGVRTFGMPDNPGYLGVCFGRVVTANSPAANKGHPVNWEAVLWHEFCHTVTLQATRNRMPRWLSEGISVYEERQADPAWGEHMTPRYRELINDGGLTPVSQLSGAFLSPKTPLHLQFAYFESSLVVEYIVEKRGMDALKAILHDLHDGTPINDALARHVVPMEEMETEFAARVKALADKLAPGLDWTKPGPELLLPDAEDALTAWMKERPDNYYALERRASRALDDKKWAEAKDPLQRLITLYPGEIGSGSARALLATVHRELDEKDAERAQLGKLAELDAAAPEVYQRMIELATAAGDWAEVVRQAQRWLAVNPLVPPPHRALALAAEKTDDSRAGIAACQTLLALDPANPAEVHYQLARWLQRTGDPTARRHVLMALEEAPRHRPALKLLLELNGGAAATDKLASPQKP